MCVKFCLLIAYVLCFVAVVHCDYDCLCNYNVENGIFATPSEQGQPIGYLYEFDCKPVLSQAIESETWITIAFEHQKGYVLKDAQIQVQVCPGEAPSQDKLTTVAVVATQTSLMQSSSAMPTVNTVEKIDTSTFPTTTKTAVTSTKVATNPTTMQTSSTTAITTPISVTAATSVLVAMTSTSSITSSAKPSTTASAAPLKSSSSTIMSSLSVSPGTSTVDQLLCPFNVQQSAGHEFGKLFINDNGRTCYEFVPTRHSWNYAENDCQSKGGHLATIGDIKDEEMVYKYVKAYGHPVWIGLHDRNHEERFEWSSGEPVVYVNWHAGRKDIFLHGIEDCVAMGPLTGTWEDMDCLDRYAYICEFDAVNGSNVPNTSPSSVGSYTDGNTALCPTAVKSIAIRDHGILGQYEHSCYELISFDKFSWEHGENMCRSRGGHLAHISSDKEQGFVQAFMNRHFPQHAVWIGLHDTRVEGQFEWTSGTAVTYTNWIPGHTSNFESFRTEDCVAFIPYMNGQWDDIPCGDNLFLLVDIGETHPIICQYAIQSSSQIVG